MANSETIKFELSKDAWNALPSYLRDMTRLDTIFNFMTGYLPPKKDLDSMSDGVWMGVHMEAADATCAWYLDNHDDSVELFDWWDIMEAFIEWRANQ